MRNIWRVFTRDLRRLLVVPQAWIILVGLVITPALYAWVNIIAFWNPYGNTQHISVAVVNLDEGATSDLTGPIDVGQQVVDRLEDNNQLGWHFVSQADATSEVSSGESYAAFVIPADFSTNLLSIASGTFTKPAIDYYVNEKANAIATKITDVGSGELESQITSTFASVVTEAATEALREAGQTIQDDLTGAQGEALATLDDATSALTEARDTVTDLRGDFETVRADLTNAQTTLDDVDAALVAARNAATQSQTLATTATGSLASLVSTSTDSLVAGSTFLAGVSAQAHTAISDVSQGVLTANGKVADGLAAVSGAVTTNAQIIDQVRQALTDAGLDPAASAPVTDALDTLATHNATTNSW